MSMAILLNYRDITRNLYQGCRTKEELKKVYDEYNENMNDKENK